MAGGTISERREEKARGDSKSSREEVLERIRVGGSKMSKMICKCSGVYRCVKEYDNAEIWQCGKCKSEILLSPHGDLVLV